MDTTASSENFYQSPHSSSPRRDSTIPDHDQVAARRRLPGSVKLAVAAGLACLGLSVLGQFSIFAPGSNNAQSQLFLVFGIASLLGLVRGMRPAYRLVQIISCLAAIRYALTFAIGILLDPRLHGAIAHAEMGFAKGMTVRTVYTIQYSLLLCEVLGFVVVYLSLRQKTARFFFGIDCGSCGQAKARVFSLLDKEVECERCRAA